MKKLITGLMALTSISAFANGVESECTFSKVQLTKSAEHYQQSIIEEDPREALIKHGFIEDLNSPNVALVTQTNREKLSSAINPATLAYELIDTIAMLDSDYFSGWMDAGRFNVKTKITLKGSTNKTIAVLSSEKVMVSDGMIEDYESHAPFEVIKKNCN